MIFKLMYLNKNLINLKQVLCGRGFPGDSDNEESACNAGDLGLFPGLGRSPGEGEGYIIQYSGLENSTDCIVMGLQRVGHD